MEKKSQQEIIARIRLYFEKTGKSLNIVAQETGMTPKNVSMFLSLKNPHRITNKTASRLCSVYPFNKNFLMYGEGELLIAEMENSTFPDRTNWTEVDYISAISTLRYETMIFLLQDHYLKLISSLSIIKDKESYNDIGSILSSIFTTECDDWTKGLNVDKNIFKDEIYFLYGTVLDRCDNLIEGYQEILIDLIYQRFLAAKELRKDLLLVKKALPEHLSQLFRDLLDES